MTRSGRDSLRCNDRLTRLAVPIFAALVLAVVVAPTAQATFPGANGRIAFTYDAQPHPGNPEIYSVPNFGGLETRLTMHAADDRSPAWNQSGPELAFASNRGPDAPSDFEIYRMPASGSPSPAQLTDNAIDDTDPAWAPGGAQLVIVRQEGAGDTDLVILAADGSGATTPLTALAPVSDEVEPNWAPNGNRIAFAAFAPGATQRDIFTISPDGSGLTNLTNTPDDDDREPNWSPGNARITYSSFSNSNYDIHVMNADGTGDSNITNDPGAADRDPAWSPDAGRIAFSSHGASGSPRIINIGSGGMFPVHISHGTEPDWAPAACSDGFDNDGDGQIDYPNDPGCTATTDDNEANPACSDGIDNDGDAKIDHPDDLGCESAMDPNETNPECIDGVDNDQDGQTDYPNDPSCSSTGDDNETEPFACTDGVDNDGDGKIDHPDDPGCLAYSDNDESNGPLVYVRPKSATELLVPLVPAYHRCDSPNRLHGPPLAHGSCAPPLAESNSETQTDHRLTIGTADANGRPTKSEGYLKIQVLSGNPSALPDEADVKVTFNVTDVRRGVGLSDYTGQLRLSMGHQTTDRWNAVSADGGSDPGTMNAFGTGRFNAPCVATADPTVGSTCSLTTTWNAELPGAVREGKRAVWEYIHISVQDGGFNQFLRPGILVP